VRIWNASSTHLEFFGESYEQNSQQRSDLPKCVISVFQVLLAILGYFFGLLNVLNVLDNMFTCASIFVESFLHIFHLVISYV